MRAASRHMSSNVDFVSRPKLTRISACLIRPVRGLTEGDCARAAVARPDAAIAARNSRRRMPRVIADNPDMSRHNPPFRADHVGSLLRPPELIAARRRRHAGEISSAELRSIEDTCIREVIRKEESIGLHSVTDGEFRRAFFHIDFLERLEGVTVSGGIETKFHSR